jgi:hypothetical protein
MQRPFLTVAANGHLFLTFEEYASSLMRDISLYLDASWGSSEPDLLLLEWMRA